MCYAGGKSHLINDIKRFIPFSLVSRTVVDVFGGSAKFLLNVESRNKVYNDLDKSMVNLWTVIRSDPASLAKRHEFAIKSRDMFEQYQREAPTGDAVEDAYRKLYVLYNSFAARVGSAATYGYNIEDNGNKSMSAMDTFINGVRALSTEIKNWNIECLDFRDLMERYDTSTTFFYLDPPYRSVRGFYNLEFTDNDFKDLASILRNIKGRYIMNIDNDPTVREIFGEPIAAIQYHNANTNMRITPSTVRTELFYTNTLNSISTLESFFSSSTRGIDVKAVGNGWF